MKFESNIFGTVEIGKDAPYIKRMIMVNDRSMNCGLYISDEIEHYPAGIVRLKEMLDDVDSFDRRARDILAQALRARNSTVIDFIDFHLEELANEIKAKLGVETLDHNIFMQGLDLRALGFHLNDGDIALWCDYCIGEAFCDELLVVKFSSDEKLIEIAHES